MQERQSPPDVEYETDEMLEKDEKAGKKEKKKPLIGKKAKRTWNPLVTVNVLYYNNGDYIYEALDSVLEQSYSRIELIVSDDRSPKGFDKEKVGMYIEKCKGVNIERVLVRSNEKNLGTVRHLETVRELGRGEIDVTIAADDALYDKNVLRDFVDKFDEDPEAMCVTTQAAMCDEELKPTGQYFITGDVVEIIEERDWDALFNKVVENYNPPGLGAAYRRELLQQADKASDRYAIIEDFPLYLYMLRHKMPVLWLNRISFLHRSGGVSHGNRGKNMRVYHMYLLDMKTIYEKEIMLSRDDISPDALSAATNVYNWYEDRRRMLENSEGKPLYRWYVANWAFVDHSQMFAYLHEWSSLFRSQMSLMVGLLGLLLYVLTLGMGGVFTWMRILGLLIAIVEGGAFLLKILLRIANFFRKRIKKMHSEKKKLRKLEEAKHEREHMIEAEL